MYRRLVVPLDDSAMSELALAHAQQLATQLDARVVLISVVTSQAEAQRDSAAMLIPERGPLMGAPAVEEEAGDAERRLAELRCELESAGVPTEARVMTGNPSDQILRVAEEEPGSLICMATHGRGGIARFALGSVADEVVRKATTPVLLVKQRA